MGAKARQDDVLTSIFLVRPGDCDQFVDGKPVDNPGLSSRGIRQAELLRDILARTGGIKADTLNSGPARRAPQTAQILAVALSASMVLETDLEEWRCDQGALSPEEFPARWQRVSDAQRPFFQWGLRAPWNCQRVCSWRAAASSRSMWARPLYSSHMAASSRRHSPTSSTSTGRRFPESQPRTRRAPNAHGPPTPAAGRS